MLKGDPSIYGTQGVEEMVRPRAYLPNCAGKLTTDRGTNPTWRLLDPVLRLLRAHLGKARSPQARGMRGASRILTSPVFVKAEHQAT